MGNVSHNIDQIEQALGIDSEYALEAHIDATNILQSWYGSPQQLTDSALILSRNSTYLVRFKASTVLLREIPSKWASYSTEDKIFIWNILTAQIKTNPEGENEKVVENIAKSIGEIAVFDFLEENFIFFEENSFEEGAPVELVRGCLIILDYFCREIEDSKSITYGTQFKLRSSCLSYAEHLRNMAEIGLQHPITAKNALMLLNSLMKWGQLSELIDVDLVNAICQEFLIQTVTLSASIECLTTIFIRRADSLSSFRQYSVTVVYALATNRDPENPELSITANPKIMAFTIKFLTRFLNLIGTIFFPLDTPDLDEDMKAELNRSADEILSTLPSYGISKQEFGEMLLTLYRIILSVDENNVDYDFWKLWNDITRKMFFEQMQQRGNEIRPIYGFFEPIIPMMRENIFNLLPEAVDETAVCSFDARSCWSMLFQVDSNSMVEFINEQTASPSLCYALGCLEFAIDRDAETAPLYASIIDLIDELQEEDDAYYISLLFASSHSVRYLAVHPESFVKVIEFIISCFPRSSEVSFAAAHSLVYVTERLSKQFEANDFEVCRRVIDASHDFIAFLKGSECVIVFRALMKLINKCDDQSAGEMITALFTPVIESFQAFVSDPSSNSMQTACDVVAASAACAGRHTPLFVETMAPVLLELRDSVVPYAEELPEEFQALLEALAGVLSIAEYPQIKDAFLETLDVLNATGDFESVFRFIAIVRSASQSVDEHIGGIMESFVLPALELEVPPLAALLEMVGAFSAELFDGDWLAGLFCAGMADFSPDVNTAAVGCWQKLVARLPTAAAREFFALTQERVMRAVLAAVCDQMHGAVFEPLSEFLRFMLGTAADLKIFDDSMVEAVAGYLRECAEEPSEGFFSEFVAFLRTAVFSAFKFAHALSDLLVSLKKLSPIDVDVFKIQETEKRGRRGNGILDIEKKIADDVAFERGSTGSPRPRVRRVTFEHSIVTTFL